MSQGKKAMVCSSAARGFERCGLQVGGLAGFGDANLGKGRGGMGDGTRGGLQAGVMSGRVRRRAEH